MPPSTASLPADERFFLSLSRAYALTQKAVERAVRAQGITVAEYALLRIIVNTPRITAAQAASRLFATAPSVTQLVQSLERKSLLARERDAKDARKRFLLPTARGRRILESCREAVLRVLADLQWSSAELSAIADRLDSLVISLSHHVPFSPGMDGADA